jgi:hypothetical protein
LFPKAVKIISFSNISLLTLLYQLDLPKVNGITQNPLTAIFLLKVTNLPFIPKNKNIPKIKLTKIAKPTTLLFSINFTFYPNEENPQKTEQTHFS